MFQLVTSVQRVIELLNNRIKVSNDYTLLSTASKGSFFQKNVKKKSISIGHITRK